jgi:outer membrane immunogenic protein
VPAFFLLFPVGVSGVAGASTVGAVPTSFKTDPRGSHVGFLLGWDWQFAPRLVAGLEADLSDSNQRGKETLTAAGSASGMAPSPDFFFFPQGIFSTASTTVTATTEQRLDWLGTVRARLGFLVTDQFLVYATGGFAFGHVVAETNLSGTLCATINRPFFGISIPSPATNCGTSSAAGSLSETRFGSAFGAGLQYLLSRNWSVKTEYIHWDLGRANYSMTPLSLLALNSVTTAFTTTAAPAGVNISTAATARFAGDIVRVSINYKLD